MAKKVACKDSCYQRYFLWKKRVTACGVFPLEERSKQISISNG